jgi:tape measure domain-containing protein
MDKNIVIKIDPQTGGGARVVRRDLDDIKRSAREAEVATGRYSAAQVRARAASLNLAAGLSSLRGALAGVGVVLSASKVIEYTDAYTRMTNALKVAGHEGKNLTAVYQQLLDSAQRNAAPIESLVTLYGRAALQQKELGVTSGELIQFTDRVALALRVAGTDAQSASGALLQLSQALGSGTVRAEEFNSILEGAPTIAQAAAAGLEEAGGSVAKLRQLVIDGEVSSKAFFRAFEAGAPMLEQKVAGAVLTIDQRMTNLQTALIDAAGRFNNSTEAANTFGEAIDNVTGFVNGIDFDNLIRQITAVIDAMRSGIQQANAWAAAIGESSGLDQIGHFVTGGKVQREFLGGALTIQSSAALRDRINGAFSGPVNEAPAGLQDQLQQLYGGAAPKVGRLAENDNAFVPTKTISLRDNPVTGGGSSKKASVSEYQRLTESIRDATREYQVEAEVIGMTEQAAELYRVEQDLLNAALKSGKADSEALRAEIEKTASSYVDAKFRAEELQEALDFAKEVTGGFFDDLYSGLRQGKSLWEAMGDAALNALDRIVDKLLNEVLDAMFEVGGAGGGLFGGGGGLAGLITSLAGSIFGGGGMTGLFANGAAFDRGNVIPFARGGVVDRPTLFGMAGGTGLMGEAGAEGILPLKRGANGRLGVESFGGSRGGQQVMRHEVVVKGVFVDDGGVVKAVAQGEAANVVGQAAPAIISRSKAETLKGLGNGDADGVMQGRYGATPRILGVG